MGALQQYSLIRRNAEEKACSLHRLVQDVLRDTMSSDLRTRWQEGVKRALNTAFPDMGSEDWTKFGRLMPHVWVWATWTEGEFTLTLGDADMFTRGGSYLQRLAKILSH
jgi:hypothetical protein